VRCRDSGCCSRGGAATRLHHSGVRDHASNPPSDLPATALAAVPRVFGQNKNKSNHPAWCRCRKVFNL